MLAAVSIRRRVALNVMDNTPSDRPANLDRRNMIGAGLGVLGGAAALSALTAAPADAAAVSAQFYGIGPYRVTDSRSGAGKIRAGQTRSISLARYLSPGFTLSVIINVTVVGTEGRGYLTLWEDGGRPGTSNINWFGSNQVLGNLAVVGLRNSDATIQLYCGGRTNATHYIVDLLAYFYRSGAAKTGSPAERR